MGVKLPGSRQTLYRSRMDYTSAASADVLMTSLPATELEIEKCRHADGAST